MLIESDDNFLDFLKFFSVNELSSEWNNVCFDTQDLFETNQLLNYPLSKKQFVFCFYCLHDVPYEVFDKKENNFKNDFFVDNQTFLALYFLINADNSNQKQMTRKKINNNMIILFESIIDVVFNSKKHEVRQNITKESKNNNIIMLLAMNYTLLRMGNYQASILLNNLIALFYATTIDAYFDFEKRKEKNKEKSNNNISVYDFYNYQWFNTNLEQYPATVLKLLKKINTIGLAVYNRKRQTKNEGIPLFDQRITKEVLHIPDTDYKNILWYYNIVHGIQNQEQYDHNNKKDSEQTETDSNKTQNTTLEKQNQKQLVNVLPYDDFDEYTGSKNWVETFEKLFSLNQWSLSYDTIDQLKQLHNKYPWMTESLDYIIKKIITQQSFANLVLKGKPGCGKSSLIKDINQIIGLPYTFYNMAGTADSMTLAGNARAWGTSTPSLPVLTMAEKQVSNPCIVVDDFDKHTGEGNNGNGYWALSKFIEPESARIFYDESLCTTVDCSGVNWIFTCNGTWNLPAMLKSRLDVVTIDNPNFSHIDIIIETLSKEWLEQHNMLECKDDFFIAQSSDFKSMANIENKKLDLRTIRRILNDSLSDQLSQMLDLSPETTGAKNKH